MKRTENEKNNFTTNQHEPTRTIELWKISLLFIISFFLLLAGCSTMVQKGGEFLEGKAFAEKKTAVYSSEAKRGEVKVELKELRSKDGTGAVEITSSDWPGFALRGDLPGSGGRFELTEARVLSSHVHGWNEFTLDLIGSAVFSLDLSPGSSTDGAESGVFRTAGDVERVQISSGQIRLKSNHLTGTAALTSLRNRRERILALTEWMAGQLHNNDSVVYNNQKAFENFWKPILFPELVSKKKRPADYSTENAEWGRADSVKWNQSYTKQLFPEGLWEYRNSGAMLRDWEEALSWIFIEYSWDTIISSINGTTLKKTKK